MKPYAVAFAWILILGSTSSLALGVPTSRPAQSTGRAADRPSDDVLTNRVFSRLRSDDTLRYYLGNVQVSARDGLVTLSGSVSRKTIQQRMEQVARSVKDVGRVVNLIVYPK